jgi:arylsulfatase A-like enzyme
VILISIDTLRADHLGLYGYPRDTSPFLDRWSEQALVFERAFTPRAMTLPAHMTMLTGLFPAQHGVDEDDQALSPQIPLLAERLRAAGYQTVGLYFSSYVHERYGFGRGFDVFRAHQDAEEAGAHLLEELARLDPARPFFLFVHLFDVHSGPFRDGQRLVYPSPAPYQDHFLADAAERLPDVDYPELTKRELSDQELEAVIALYDGGIRYVDAQLERCFGELERARALENALVIVTADHGENLGERSGRLGQHGWFWNEGLHVPLIVRHPRGLRAGERVTAPVHLADVVPTVLELTGLPSDPSLPGRSLLGELPADRVLAGSSKADYVLQWPRKLLRLPRGACWSVDLAADPAEISPSAVAPEVFEELQARAFPAQQRYPAPLRLDALTEAERDELRALGYGGEEDGD